MEREKGIKQVAIRSWGHIVKSGVDGSLAELAGRWNGRRT